MSVRLSVAAALIILPAFFLPGCHKSAKRSALEGAKASAARTVEPDRSELSEIVEQHWPDGSLRLRKHVLRKPDGTVVDHGELTRWYVTGEKEYEGVYVRGRKHGTTTRWHRNGRKWIQQQYVDGVRSGVSWMWDESGTKRKEEQHLDGKPHGPWTLWDKHGEIRWRQSYEHGCASQKPHPGRK